MNKSTIHNEQGNVDHLYYRITAVVDFQKLHKKENEEIICIIIFCESPSQGKTFIPYYLYIAVIQSLLSKNIILYVFDQSPYYKHSYTNPDLSKVHHFVSDEISSRWNIDSNWLTSNIPSVIRLLKSERLIISEYTSPNQLEV